MNRLLLSTAATALLLSPLACDFEKTGNQFLAKKVMVGTLLSTPDVAFSPTAAAGIDAGTLSDGGTFDQITLPGQTAAFVFFGTREGEQGAPEPIANATVRVEAATGGQINLENEGAGTYGHTSDFGEDAGVKYQPGKTYRFVAVQNGTSHVGTVEEAPALERIEALHPAEGYLRRPANQPLTLQRPAVPSNQERTHGFVTVVPLSKNGDQGQPTYTSAPKEPLRLLELVALPNPPSKAASLEIPGSAFPQKDSNYLVIFQTMKTGGPESDNLFVGSALLVGTADVGVVHTQP
ncbi:hypothetical protein [Archangium sp.]|jgi:hypothetical protein|uniref:hypothetical protein n=1 Tax=Archangium sp. TaxID=1872627 RepID=UPI002ED9A33A